MRPRRITEQHREVVARRREPAQDVQIRRGPVLVGPLELFAQTFATCVGHDRCHVRRVRADPDRAVGAGGMGSSVVARESIELAVALESHVARVVADVPRVVLPEPRQLGAQPAGAVPVGGTELDSCSPHVHPHQSDKSTLHRPETLGSPERVVHRRALQCGLAEFGRIALKSLSRVANFLVGMHRHADPALAHQIRDLAMNVVERGDGPSRVGIAF